MKMPVLFRLALVASAVGAIQNLNAGSAVACAGEGQWATAYGGPVEREKQRALAEARLKYGTQARIVAATGVVGYGAIAVAWHPSGHGSIVGISLGKRSATEADTLAIEKCLKAGGIKPQVKWAFRG
jgi:hypothetical protein